MNAGFPTVLAAIAASATLALPAARADTVVLDAFADNTMYEGDDDASNGAGDYVFAGMTNSDKRRRALLAFDVAAGVPAGATITSVQLALYMSRTDVGGRDVSLHVTAATWGEAGSVGEGQEGAGGPAQPGDATWAYRFWATDPWASPGGDYVGSASATISVSGNGTYTWGSTAAMVADVQGWLDDPPSDNGWVLVGQEDGQSAKRFNSRTSGQTSRRPKLTVTFELAAACCLGDGTCMLLNDAACASAGGAYQGAGTDCTPNPCVQPLGACCFLDGSCAVLTQSNCSDQGGAYEGNMTVCAPNPCPQPIGACCFDSGLCQDETEGDCATLGGTYQGDDVACVPFLCPVILEPFVDPLPLPAPAPPDAGDPNHYDITIERFEQSLHSAMTPITLYGYNGGYPGPTIEATSGQPITVTWINDLTDAQGDPLLAHDLTVDTYAHGADDQSPRTVVHLHGGHVPPEADGYPDHWFLPGSSDTYLYPNNQPAGTLWYHDHALGITRLNVMMGMAGFYLVRDDVEAGLGLPSGEYEIPLVVQDRIFGYDGTKHTLVYPDTWQQDFFGDTLLVNGKVWPFLNVKQGLYRFRLLNGSNTRTYTFALDSGQTFQIIGTDGGFLPAPVEVSEITLASGERVDVIVDFSAQAPGTEIILTNSASAPYPGVPGVGVIPQVMKFIVLAEAGDPFTIPATLDDVDPLPETHARHVRDFVLAKEDDPCSGSIWLINGLGWDDITEFPRLDSIEVWRFINQSGMMHPMHMHLVFFQVLDRQPFTIVDGEIVATGPAVPVGPEEAGWKDTVKAMPFEITRVIAKFTDYEGLFAYHCHILEHEDHEMMRQFETLPPCGADLNGSDAVDFADLLAVLSTWGPCASCPEDLDGNGEVGFGDLLIVLSTWGPCPM